MARSRVGDHDDRQISYEYIRLTAREEDQLGLIELHFKFGNEMVTARGAVALVPSKGKRYSLRTDRFYSFRAVIVQANVEHESSGGLYIDASTECPTMKI